MAGEIPTTERVEIVGLECGGRAFVRRLRRSMRNDVARVAGLTYDIASSNMFAELACRLVMTGVENLKDGDVPVAYRTESHPVLGRLASREVFDAITDTDVQAILRVAGAGSAPGGAAGGLDEGSLGN
jgi:hypothetical protein